MLIEGPGKAFGLGILMLSHHHVLVSLLDNRDPGLLTLTLCLKCVVPRYL